MTRDGSATNAELVDLIRRFVHGSVGPYEWDDFMGAPFADQTLEAARIECEGILRDFEQRVAAGSSADEKLLAIAQRLEARTGGTEKE